MEPGPRNRGTKTDVVQKIPSRGWAGFDPPRKRRQKRSKGKVFLPALDMWLPEINNHALSHVTKEISCSSSQRKSASREHLFSFCFLPGQGRPPSLSSASFHLHGLSGDRILYCTMGRGKSIGKNENENENWGLLRQRACMLGEEIFRDS